MPITIPPLGFDPNNTPAQAPISLAESQDIRARVKSLQDDWKLVVAQAVASAKVAEALEPRVKDLEQRIKQIDQIATRLHDLVSRLDALDARTVSLDTLGPVSYDVSLFDSEPPKKKYKK